mgnify:CR=1 FL=1
MSYQHLTFWDTIGFSTLGVFYCKLQVSKRHITCAINISNFRLLRSLLLFISSIHKHICGDVYSLETANQIRTFGKKWLVYWIQKISGFHCPGMIRLFTEVALFWFLAGQFLSQVMLNEQWGCEISLWLRTICTPHNL